MAINPTEAAKIQNGSTVIRLADADMPQKVNGGNGQNHSSVSANLSPAETKDMVNSLEGYMEILQTSLGFSVNEESDGIIVTITNKETDEVIRQIPPEELVALREKMKELTGIIFNETA